MHTDTTKKWVLGALFAALTTVCTMILRIPTPTGGYIHPGDGMVLLCGILLGPGIGALAAGIGSMLSDLFSGYLAWVPATLIIKALSAMIAGFFYHGMSHRLPGKKGATLRVIFGGILAEAFMVCGYFLFEAGLNTATSGSLSSASIAGAVAYSAAGIPANLMQGIAGIVIACLLLPLLRSVTNAD